MSGYRMVVKAARQVALEEFDAPQPSDNELLIAARSTLISPGTERASFLGLPNAPQEYPIIPGYSAVSEVVQIGANVEGWHVGERVVSAAPHASHAVLKADQCLKVPDEVSDEDATFFHLAAIAMQGVRKARIELGEPVVVIGAGLVGLLAMQLARLSGAMPVIAIDREAERLELAQRTSADTALLADEDVTASVHQLCEGEGAPVVIEATGVPQAILSAFALAARDGRVVLLGSTRGVAQEVNFYRDVHFKGLTVLGAHNRIRPQSDSSPGFWTLRDDQSLALRLLAQQRLKVAPFITHRFPAREAVRAYDLLQSPQPAALGMILHWKSG